MLEIILLFGVIFIILTFFYKQAVCEFRINQLEWSQRDNVSSLLHEKVPLVLRSIPSASFWTIDDVTSRECYQNIPIFQETSLVEWVSKANVDSVCPWKYPQAETIAAASGMAIWAKKWFHPMIMNPFLKLWMTPRYHCWAGNMGLRKTFATWTCLFPVDGEILVSIMTEAVESALPAEWVGCFPSQLTAKDTPFVADVKYIDIVLRPGSCLFMPAHWFVSWTSTDGSKVVPMACTISYHTPISLLAFHASPYTF
jgi:hypothetical protein